ncbi:MAG: deoxyribodipyrimidine photolyase, partial [Gemmatimonadota bacterium]
MDSVPASRIGTCNDAPVREDGDFVLYWMTAFRRTLWNFSLQRALEWARKLRKPLVVIEALRSDYRWSSDRTHRFILDGMTDNARRLRNSPVLYYSYVEASPGAGRGLLAALGDYACVVVTDDYPAFFLPRMVSAAARRLSLRLEKVDSNGLLPLRVGDRPYETAYAFRRFLQKTLPTHLTDSPAPNPLRGVRLPRLEALPVEITRRWPDASPALLADEFDAARLPIDHAVTPADTPGGPTAAVRALQSFLDNRLARYAEERNHPDLDASSGLSPYLHFGHISSHQIFSELMA